MPKGNEPMGRFRHHDRVNGRETSLIAGSSGSETSVDQSNAAWCIMTAPISELLTRCNVNTSVLQARELMLSQQRAEKKILTVQLYAMMNVETTESNQSYCIAGATSLSCKAIAGWRLMTSLSMSAIRDGLWMMVYGHSSLKTSLASRSIR